jgi:hypothetical protein
VYCPPSKQLSADQVDWLAGLPDQVRTVVCGHTHMPFTRLANTRQIVNPGSVGMPHGRQGAHWAILRDGAVETRRTGYDAAAACAQVEASSSYPDVAEWADYFLHARATDADALAVLGPAMAGKSQRCALSSVSDPGFSGMTQNGRPAGSRSTHHECTC